MGYWNDLFNKYNKDTIKSSSQDVSSSATDTSKADTETTVYDPTALASSYGDLEIQLYLYKLGLSNVYDSYKQSIASLNQEQKSNLQDQYYLMQMSKKYLGENASNNGTDVASGDLLSIYSAYQDAVKEINTDVNDQKLSLLQNYNDSKTAYMQDIIQSQYDIDTSKKINKTQVASDLANLLKVSGGKIDAAVIDETVAKDIITNIAKQLKDNISFLRPTLEDKMFYIAWSNKGKNQKNLISDFNFGLKTIKKTGLFDKILKEFE